MSCFLSKRNIAVELYDATAVTPLSWVAKYWGDVSWTNGGYAETDIMDEYGEFVTDTGPLKGDAAVSTITLNNLKLRDKGQDATNLKILDIVNRLGKYADVVSTTDGAGNCESSEKTFTLKVTVTHDGATATYYWHRVTVQPASVTFNGEGGVVSITFTSRQAYPASADENA